MDVYVLVDCERHTDPQPMVFAREDLAIAIAESTATAYAREGEELDTFRSDGMKKGGWIYYAGWGTEGDFLFVAKRPVNGAVYD